MPLNPVRVALENGVVVIAQENHLTPAISLLATIRAGGYDDPPGREGTAALMARVLDRGTANRSADVIADDLDGRGASLSVSAGRHQVAVSAACLVEDLEPVLKNLEKSPVFVMMQTWGLEKTYVEPSGLSDEEKVQGHRTIERAFRGLVEQKITHEQFTGVVPSPPPGHADVKVENGKTVIKTSRGDSTLLTDEEVRTMLADLKKLADDAEIPDEPFTIDIGDEVKRIVDRGLGKQVP